MPVTVLTNEDIRKLDEELLRRQQQSNSGMPTMTMAPEYEARVAREMSGRGDTTADRRISCLLYTSPSPRDS